jgi:hypothetical protein
VGVFAVRREPLTPKVLQTRLIVKEATGELKQGTHRFKRPGTYKVTAVNRGGIFGASSWQERVAGGCLRRARFFQ